MSSVHELTFLSSGVCKNKLENEEGGRERWVTWLRVVVTSAERLLQWIGKRRKVNVRS